MSASRDQVPPSESPPSSEHGPLPVVVDLGKKRRKQIKQLRQGRGKLMDAVSQVVQELKDAGTVAASAQPIVIVVREKPRSMPWMDLMR